MTTLGKAILIRPEKPVEDAEDVLVNWAFDRKKAFKIKDIMGDRKFIDMVDIEEWRRVTMYWQSDHTEKGLKRALWKYRWYLRFSFFFKFLRLKK